MISLIMSRDEIEESGTSPFPPHTAVISITDADWTFAELKHQPEWLLQLKFDDVDNDVFKDEPETSRGVLEEKYHMFNDAMAKQVADFYFQIQGKAKIMICQCENDQYRSAAISAAINEYRSGSGIEIFADDDYYPNKRVFNMTLNQLRECDEDGLE